jgi:hypothetical protein
MAFAWSGTCGGGLAATAMSAPGLHRKKKRQGKEFKASGETEARVAVGAD